MVILIMKNDNIDNVIINDEQNQKIIFDLKYPAKKHINNIINSFVGPELFNKSFEYNEAYYFSAKAISDAEINSIKSELSKKGIMYSDYEPKQMFLPNYIDDDGIIKKNTKVRQGMLLLNIFNREKNNFNIEAKDYLNYFLRKQYYKIYDNRIYAHNGVDGEVINTNFDYYTNQVKISIKQNEYVIGNSLFIDDIYCGVITNFVSQFTKNEIYEKADIIFCKFLQINDSKLLEETDDYLLMTIEKDRLTIKRDIITENKEISSYLSWED